MQVDPGVLEDGVTVADLVEQQNFLLQVRDAIADGEPAAGADAAGDGEGRCPAGTFAGPGEWIADIAYAHPLQRLWARLVTAPGIYEQGMLIDQLGNIARAEGGADQKVGAESRRRLDDLLAEMKAIEGELKKLGDR